MKCNNCGNEQETGNFCGKCGFPIQAEHEQQTSATTGSQVEQSIHEEINKDSQNETFDRVKQQSKQYWGYFVYYLKHPTSAIQHTNESKNGLISIGVYALLMTILLTSFLNTLIGGIGLSNYYSTRPSMSIAFGYLIVCIMSIFIAITTLYVVNRIFGKPYTYKQIISVYSGFLSLPIILNVIAFIFLLIHSYVFFGISVLLAYILVLGVIPIYIITVLLQNTSKKLDSFYGYLIFYVAYMIMNGILFTILADSILGDLIDTFEMLFNNVPFL
ncbi:hypothetical protein ACIQ4I_08150 [Rummeliibacillus sp. NPDC094406]|uniref:hypothetical protein n=1 Tax=Rummeliibacillus sp. NPDC094406 TaxID=3364511 RepID=UPI0037F6ACF7